MWEGFNIISILVSDFSKERKQKNKIGPHIFTLPVQASVVDSIEGGEEPRAWWAVHQEE